MTRLPTAILAALALALALAGAAAPAAAQQNLLETEQAQVAQLASVRDELAIGIERLAAANVALAERLDAFDPELEEEPATLESLRQIQFEVNLAQTRLETMARRAEVTQANIAGLDVRIAQLTARLPPEGPQTLQQLADEALLGFLVAQREIQREILADLARYRTVSAEHLALLREALELERERISLEAVIDIDEILVDPVVSRIRLRVAELNQQNVSLSNEASGLALDTPQALERRNLLQLKADTALLEANARLVDIDIVVARRTLDALGALVGESGVPADLLERAAERTIELIAFLSELEAERTRNLRALQDLLQIAGDADAEGPLAGERAQLANRLDALERLFADQRREIESLLGTARPLRERLEADVALRNQQALTEREVTRVDAFARGRLADEVAELPGKMLQTLEESAETVANRVAAASEERLGLSAAAVVAVVLLAILLRQVVLPRIMASRASTFTTAPVAIVRNRLVWLMPALVFGALAATLALPRDVVRLWLAILLVPAVASFVRGLLQETVISRAEGRRRVVGERIRALTTGSVVVIAAVVVAYTILGDTFVLPSTRSWINRLVFLSFVIAAIPMFLFALFFTAHARDESTTTGQVALAGLSLVPPLLLVGIGVIGLLGYTRLATELFADFAMLAGVLVVLAFSIAVLHDLLEAAIARVRAKDPARAYFLRSNFARPLNRFGQIVLAVVAFATIWDLFDLSTDMPVVREVIAVLSQPLFETGGTTYRVGSILLAVVGLWAVFWIGGWSQRVSYTILYRGVRDLGIRQSLSVFTKYVVIVLGLLMTLSLIGFDITTLTVFAASLGVGIGFGMQNVVNNFISGILILIERPLRIGDIVTVTGNTGTVDAIGIRSLRLRTFDEYDVIVPNSAVISDTFVNWSRTDKVIRQLITVGIAYGDDPRKAVEIVRGIVEGFQPPILATPPASVTVDEFAESSVNIRVAYYIELGGSVGLFDIRDHVLSEIWTAFRREGITIPFPQRDLHLVSMPKGASDGLSHAGGELPRALEAADRTARGPAEPEHAGGRGRTSETDDE